MSPSRAYSMWTPSVRWLPDKENVEALVPVHAVRRLIKLNSREGLLPKTFGKMLTSAKQMDFSVGTVIDRPRMTGAVWIESVR